MRVRFAPSPTGFLHLGGLRTALFNYLIAKKHPEGKFILRIEDTDQSRLVPSAIEGLQETLRWAGLDYDEGPDKAADSKKYGPYIQSQRLPIYQEHSKEITESGRAYRCFCSKDRLEMVKGINGRYDGHCRSLSKEESQARVNNNEPFVLRFKTSSDSSNNNAPIKDHVFGLIKNSPVVDDVILMKSDGYPTYHFANVIDDHLMEIDLVMRGAEWIPSVPLHAALFDSFGWNRPQYAHLPLLINPDGSKLSKRQDSAHVSHYINSGYLPSALINFVAFLGWNPKNGSTDEVFGLEELVNVFDLKGLNNSDAAVNLDKLKWLNRQHLKLESVSERLVDQLRSLLKDKYNNIDNLSSDYLSQVIKVSSDRIFFLKDILDLCPYYFIDPDYKSLESQEMLSKINKSVLDSVFHVESFKELKSMLLLRLIVTGCRIGPSIQETVKVLGEETCQRRFDKFKRTII